MKDIFKSIMKRSFLLIKLHDFINNNNARNTLDVILFPLSMLFVIFKCFSRESNHTKFKISIVAIIKNEGPYLEEWLEYHIKNGIEHFYLYDNDSDDNSKQILRKYISSGIVTFRTMHGFKRQHDAYNDALNRYSKESKFLAFIDLDEFIYTDHLDLYELLNNNLVDKKSALVLNWLIFGSSGHTKKPKGYIIEYYLYRSIYNNKKNHHVKTICNPRKTLAFVNAHYAKYFWGVCY